MRKLTFSEWVAVFIAIVVVSYFFFFNGTVFSFNQENSSMNQIESDVVTNTDDATTSNQNDNNMTQETKTLPGIQITDTVVGTGEEAVAGKTVVVNYTGKFTDGKVFDSSIPRGQPFDFKLGAGMVIKGWDEGVAGMKVGGKRTLVISPEKAYGERGAGNVIPPNSTLVFDVELLDVQD
jgi:peptidylprolyl isomerase/FKBP-type peptidyl-prolyl cis-trans isomerase FkpA